MNEGQIVHALGEVRKQIADPMPALPVPLEGKRALHQVARLAKKRVDLHSERLAVLFLEFRLVIKGIDMTHPSRAEDQQYALGLGSEVRDTSFGCKSVAMQQPGERNPAKAKRVAQEGAAINRITNVHSAIHLTYKNSLEFSSTQHTLPRPCSRARLTARSCSFSVGERLSASRYACVTWLTRLSPVSRFARSAR